MKNAHVLEDSGRTSEGNFADYTEYSTRNDKTPKVYCQSNVNIADGVTLTNNGSIFIGGVLGRNGQAPTGMTVGKYSKITLGSGSSILNTGEITSYGFIKEKEGVRQPAKVSSSGNGILNLPIVIYDFRGGSFSSYAVGALRISSWKAMPFNVFDFPNVQCDVYFTGKSVLNGTITVYANDKVVTSSASLIGPSDSSSLIRLTSGTIKYRCSVPNGYLYDDYAQGTAENKINRTKFTVNGNVNIANMEINVGVSIKTSEFHLPFSYKFAFDFESGEINISNKVKLLAGCVFHIGQKASVNVNAETVFYQNYIPVITTGRGDGYPRYTKSASLINDGILTINSTFGGVVNSASQQAKIITGNSFSGGVGTTEALTGQTGGLRGTEEDHTENAMFTLIDKQFFDVDDDKKMLYGKANSTLNSDKISGGTSYTSYALGKTTDYGWYDGVTLNDVTYGIRYELNSATAINPNDVSSFNKTGSSIALKKLTNSSDKLLFDGFYYDSSFTKRLENNGDGNPVLLPSVAIANLDGKNHVVLYAKWVDASKAKYSFESVTSITNDHLSVKQNSSSPTSYILGEKFTLEKPISFYVYENLATDKGTGTISTYNFDGYSIKIYNENNELVGSTIEVDKDGNSFDGMVRGFVFDDVSSIKENYKVIAIAKYTNSKTNFTLSVSPSSNTVSVKGSVDVSLSGVNQVFDGISLTYQWSSSNTNKATFTNSTQQSTTVKSGYTGTGWSSTTIKISCIVKDGDLLISQPYKDIEFRKGTFE